jgi:hypothetical protein
MLSCVSNVSHEYLFMAFSMGIALEQMIYLSWRGSGRLFLTHLLGGTFLVRGRALYLPREMSM